MDGDANHSRCPKGGDYHMSILGDKLIAAGLPVMSSDEIHTTFSRSLSEAEEALYMSIAFPPDYLELRRREYPPLTELADAIYWQENNDKEPMRVYVAKCKVVKDKYPKP